MRVLSKRDVSRLGRVGDAGTYSTDSGVGLDTSGVAVGTPTDAQLENSLTAIAKSSCDNSGGIWNPSDSSCSGSGGSPTCPTGYVLNGIACQLPNNPTATVPATVSSSLSGNYILLGGVLLAMIFIGGHR